MKEQKNIERLFQEKFKNFENELKKVISEKEVVEIEN